MHIFNKALITRAGFGFGFKDLIAISILLGVLAVVAKGMNQMAIPIGAIESSAISLSPTALPGYALQTVLRFFCAMIFSVIFAILYGTLAAKNKYAESILIPALDIFQSIPVLGYISFTVTGFLLLFPGSSTGLQLASVFAAFTNQVPNMTFSFYQSLKTIPEDLRETCTIFGMSAGKKFCTLELPFAMPGLIWNCMMSMSGGWFLIVATEAITVNMHLVMLPGVGSYIAQAINQHSIDAIGYAVLSMLIVIFLYDQLLFRPLIAWGDKFHSATNENTPIPKSLILSIVREIRIFKLFTPIFSLLALGVYYLFLPLKYIGRITSHIRLPNLSYLWYTAFAILAVYALKLCYEFIDNHASWDECLLITKLGFYTMLRVISMIFLASLIWVPIGVYVGLRPSLAEKIEPLAQFLAAFPANIIFPIAVIYITKYHLNPNIWLSPLMVLGTQWYILFNVIAGASAFPVDLLYAANMAGVRRLLWWRKVMLPGIFPYLVTGAITAAGGAWNASIVAEIVSWGNTHIVAEGIGAYISQATASGNMPHLMISIGIMSLYVIFLNRLVWRPLYNLAERKAKLG